MISLDQVLLRGAKPPAVFIRSVKTPLGRPCLRVCKGGAAFRQPLCFYRFDSAATLQFPLFQVSDF
jgi:hypothetical protein